jgi:hypothetical protein
MTSKPLTYPFDFHGAPQHSPSTPAGRQSDAGASADLDEGVGDPEAFGCLEYRRGTGRQVDDVRVLVAGQVLAPVSAGR